MTTQTPRRALTVADIEDGYDNPEWMGYGYLGGRHSALTDSDTGPARPALVAAADARIIAMANERRWSAADLFLWLNSRPGRRLADAWFGGSTGDDLEAVIRREFNLPTA